MGTLVSVPFALVQLTVAKHQVHPNEVGASGLLTAWLIFPERKARVTNAS